MVELSIIMPVYNGETYLRQAIDSILNQTYTNFELIVIDDASTDGTAKIIRSYNDPRIKVIRNLDHQGNYPSRNKGQEIAIGKYFCVMDADDISYPRRLEVQYTYMENHPDILAIGTSFDFSISGLKRDLPLSYEQIQLALLDNNSFLHPSIMVRADVMRMHGGYNEKYIYSSDYDLMARLALSGKVENLPDVLMMYQCHECQISQKYKREQEMYADEIRRKYQIEFINRYKTKEMTSPDEWAIGYPLLGKIIALYTYANFTCKPEYEETVSDLWDSFLKNNICIIPSLGKEVSLCCLGCGLIYILRNGLADEDENEILADLDSRLTNFNLKWQDENNKVLMGWIHYLTLRIEKKDSPLLLQSKVNLLQHLDQLSEEKKQSVAIIYLAIGKYDIFWEDFYQSCEQFLFPDAVKHYFVFTDSRKLLSESYHNASMVYRKDKGWGNNTIAKFDCVMQIKDKCSNFDYMIYINANYQAFRPINFEEIKPQKSDNYLFALSFDHILKKGRNAYPYDRNTDSRAYIPYDQGKYYYQASFFGGRTPEFIELVQTCQKDASDDISKGIMALWHDESYLNKYLLNLSPHIIKSLYCKPEEFDGDYKGILRDKKKVLGIETINQLKAAFIDPDLSFLLEKDMTFRPLHLILSFGRLGNQLFQYAFLLGLRHRFPEAKFCMHFYPMLDKKNMHLCNIFDVFDLPIADIAQPELYLQVKGMSNQHIIHVLEQSNSYQLINSSTKPVSVYDGYWQTELYFKDIEQTIRKVFHFNESKLSPETKKMAVKIKAGPSVSLHIRRGDYLSGENHIIYGNICTRDYYLKAIEELHKRINKEQVKFFIFTDDPLWVKENFHLENSVVVDNNEGKEAWQDMYLMSICNHNIIANSSFSWWGAWLNSHSNKIVIAPYRWYNTMLAPNILPDGWISILPHNYIYNGLTNDLEHNKLSLCHDGLFYGRMGLVIFLFHFSRLYKDIFYHYIAENILESILDNLNQETPLDYSNGLLGIGTAIEYLLLNDFITGDPDEILEDFDRLINNAINIPSEDTSLESGLRGWIRYLEFRTSISKFDRDLKRLLLNTRNLESLKLRIKEKGIDPTTQTATQWDNSIGLRGRSGMELEKLGIQISTLIV